MNEAPDASTTPRKAAAFFDFDKTLFHGDSGVLFGRSLGGWAIEDARRHKSPFRRWLRYGYILSMGLAVLVQEAFFRTLYKLGLIKRSTLVRLGYRFLRGFPAKEMYERMAVYVHDNLRHRIYPEMVERIQRHREVGQPVVIVTTGLKSLVEHFKEYLGQDVVVIGCEMTEEDGFWAGRVTGPLYGVHKVVAIEAYAEENGIDLSKSFAYSDHWSDVPFLEAVGNPVVVNPGRRLRALARLRGWSVLEPQRPTKPTPLPQ